MKEIIKNALEQIENDYQEFKQAVFSGDLTAFNILKKIRIKEKNFSKIGININPPLKISDIFTQAELETVCYDLWIKGAKNYYPDKKSPHCDYPFDFDDANLYHFLFLKKLNFKPSSKLLGKIFIKLMSRNEYEAYKFSMDTFNVSSAIPINKEVAKRLSESRNYTYFNDELINDRVNGPKNSGLSWQEYEKKNGQKVNEILSNAKQIFLTWQHEYYSVVSLKDKL